jgi:hypothetical protein
LAFMLFGFFIFDMTFPVICPNFAHILVSLSYLLFSFWQPLIITFSVSAWSFSR